MPRKAPAKKRQSTASKREASTVKAGSKTRPAKPKRNAPASKSKSSGDSIDALVKKQLAALKRADTLFKDAVSISEDSNSLYRFQIDVVDGDPKYGVALDQEEPNYLDRSEWQKQFHVRLAKTIATIIVKRGSEK